MELKEEYFLKQLYKKSTAISAFQVILWIPLAMVNFHVSMALWGDIRASTIASLTPFIGAYFFFLK